MEPTPESAGATEIEELVFACLDDVDGNLEAAIDECCARFPEKATSVRRVFERLREQGLLDTGAPTNTRIGGYELVERLGAGGMGVVWKARDPRLGRDVALKIMRPDLQFFEGSSERFRHEIAAVARLNHPGIVPVYGADTDDGVPFYTMELVAGCTLAAVLERFGGRDPSRLKGDDLRVAIRELTTDRDTTSSGSSELFSGTWSEACFEVARQVADAMCHAHDRGVLHRDIKPSNIILTPDGRARVFDFGLARMEDAQRLTKTSTQIGSLPYLPPEQIDGAPVEPGPRLDVYSLGVTLYEMLTLRSPYLAAHVGETRRRILHARPVPPRRLNPALPWDAGTVCLTAMAPERERRYPTMHGLLQDLENVRTRHTIQAKRPGPLLRFRRWQQRNAQLSLAMSVAALILMLGAFAFAVYEASSRRTAEGLKEHALRQRYALQIQKAYRAIKPGDTFQAARVLAETDPDRRGIEWNLVHRSTDTCDVLMQGHLGAVYGLSWSRDGTRIATRSSLDDFAWIRDAKTGASVRKIPFGEKHVGGLAFSPVDDRLALPLADSIVLYGTDGEVSLRLEAPAGALRSGFADVEFSRDGHRLVAASHAGRVFAWDLRQPDAEPIRLKGHRGPLSQIVRGPGPQQFLTLGRDRLAKAWNLEKRQVKTMQHDFWLVSGGFAKNGAEVVTVDSSGTMHTWNAETGSRIRKERLRFRTGVNEARFYRNGRMFVIDGPGSHLQLWGTDPLKFLALKVGHTFRPTWIEFSPDGRSIAAGGFDGTTRIWPTRPRPLGNRMAVVDRTVHRVRYVAKNRVVSGGFGGKLRLFDAARREQIWAVTAHDARIDAIAATADGRLLSAASDGSFRVSALQDGRELHTTQIEKVVEIVAMARGGVVVASRGGTLRWLDSEARTTATLEVGETLQQVDRLGERELICATPTAGLCIVDCTRRAIVRWIKTGAVPVNCLSAARSGATVLTGHDDGTTHEWRIADGVRTRSLSGHSRPMQVVRYAADDTRVFTVARLGTRLWLWDAATGEHLLEMTKLGGIFDFDVADDASTFALGGMRPEFLFVVSTAARTTPTVTGAALDPLAERRNLTQKLGITNR